MGFTLKLENNGCFLIDGLPYQRGAVLPVFQERNGIKRANEVQFIGTDGREITTFCHYSEITNGTTGNPFVSMNDILAYMISYVFLAPISGGASTSGQYYDETYSIVAAAPGAGELLAGASVTIPNSVGKTITRIFIDGVYYDNTQFNHNTATGELSLVAGNFSDGEVLGVVGYEN